MNKTIENVKTAYKEYLKRMLNGSAPIEETMSFKEYWDTE